MKKIKVFLLDNVDSFTYNLVDELTCTGMDLIVYRNIVSADVIFDKMVAFSHSHHVVLLLSPGPGNPSQAGCMLSLLSRVQGAFPVLGICLGHQAIAQLYGSDIVRAKEVMHGKSSYIDYKNHPVFANLPADLPVARYHSLMADNVSEGLEVIADIDGTPMAICHQEHKMLGFQFHPESILTSHGSQLLSQSIQFLTQEH